MRLLWDHPPHNPQKWICDVPEVGRYLIQRRHKGARDFVLKLNGQGTKYYGTIDELKTIVIRIVEAKRA